ncbi:hypothetical protein N8E89_24255 (plasmid) [Phyllobacterium sp. A18/5-2]|uniref:hypothetical protein n=1 Tax=Phyllobacterium sp. A18/5-2 TaxID=2978392 RepID=UPI0021C68A3E|nr:hypothetical protein [Phyllobacterium sp. A18/5-2]UXN66287.1 hypothetical protein N8E89_24255 [Phyllobacterium sp. A18/5-2]
MVTPGFEASGILSRAKGGRIRGGSTEPQSGPFLCPASVSWIKLAGASLLVLMPYNVTFDRQNLHFPGQMAWAKDGAESGAKGQGNGDGISGKSEGSGGGNNESNGRDKKDGTPGNSGNAKGGKVNRSTTDGFAIEVRHANGMSESITHGRYVMKDAKGRTIINRTATPLDLSRLQLYAR